eukprot:36872-Pelagomonas_calceolata.AAC.2
MSTASSISNISAIGRWTGASQSKLPAFLTKLCRLAVVAMGDPHLINVGRLAYPSGHTAYT